MTAPSTEELQQAQRSRVADGELYAWVQPLFEADTDPATKTFTQSRRRAKNSRLWVCRRGGRPTETVFTIESIKTADVQAVADAINRRA